MIKVLQPFYNGNTFYNAGLEIADDPALEWAEARGLVEKIKDTAPAEKKPTKKPATKKK